jgi:dTDP-4-amino-4,6-dideoxygalactose transaminase
MKNNFIPYGHQWIDDEDIKEVVKILKSDWITQGPKVEEFEKAVAKYCQVKYAVAVSSGTAALYTAYKVAGIRPGDEIITTPLTFAATSNCIVQLEGKPVFADIQGDTLNINPREIGKKITQKTKAIVLVDFAGHPCDYDEIRKIAKRHKLLIIEDAAHALGSEYKEKRCGSLGDIGCFSIGGGRTKTIGTGEGGIIVVDDDDLAEKCRNIRNHGDRYTDVDYFCFNFRMSELNAAVEIGRAHV